MQNKVNDPGLGIRYEKNVRRLLNEDGSYNIKRKGGAVWYRDAYKFLIDISGLHFLFIVFCTYLGLNLIFALLYYLLGSENILGINSNQNLLLQCFYFSAQTFTTVGYGGLTPNSNAINIVATIEAFVGFLSFSLATGILYGRFSKPNSKINFSKNIILTSYKENNAIMFKMVNARKNVLLKAHADVILIRDKKDSSVQNEKEYFQLKLEVSDINFFPLTWTVVHNIDENSPLKTFKFEEVESRNVEIIVLIKAFDETFSQEIFEKYSYAHHQWKKNVKFSRNFKVNKNGVIELFVDDLNDLETLPN